MKLKVISLTYFSFPQHTETKRKSRNVSTVFPLVPLFHFPTTIFRGKGNLIEDTQWSTLIEKVGTGCFVASTHILTWFTSQSLFNNCHRCTGGIKPLPLRLRSRLKANQTSATHSNINSRVQDCMCQVTGWTAKIAPLLFLTRCAPMPAAHLCSHEEWTLWVLQKWYFVYLQFCTLHTTAAGAIDKESMPGIVWIFSPFGQHILQRFGMNKIMSVEKKVERCLPGKCAWKVNPTDPAAFQAHRDVIKQCRTLLQTPLEIQICCDEIFGNNGISLRCRHFKPYFGMFF